MYNDYKIINYKKGEIMEKFEKQAKIFKAFCDANRLRILNLLKQGEMCGCRLLEELNIEQPTLSHHMRILCDANIIDGRKEGKWTYYSLNKEGIIIVKKILEDIE